MTRRLPIDCAICGEPFVPNRATHTVCSDECRKEAKRVQEDGKRQIVNVPAMSFQDIALKLRVSKPTVQKDYYNALAKLAGVVTEILDPFDMPGGTRVRIDFDGRTWKTETVMRPARWKDRAVVYVRTVAAGVAPLAEPLLIAGFSAPIYLVPLDSVTSIDKRFPACRTRPEKTP